MQKVGTLKSGLFFKEKNNNNKTKKLYKITEELQLKLISRNLENLVAI